MIEGIAVGFTGDPDKPMVIAINESTAKLTVKAALAIADAIKMMANIQRKHETENEDAPSR